VNLTDLDRLLGGRLLAAADWLRQQAYALYEKADDLHYYLDTWDRTLHTERGPW
jgi:hypothetical protein